jgi:putative DNA primase/helicase
LTNEEGPGDLRALLTTPIQEYTAVIKEKTAVNPPIVENIPEQLTERPQWVCWRLEERDGKQKTKVPYVPGTLRRASTTDLMSWRSFSEALEAYEAAEPPYDGIGFVFSSADPFVAIDLDDCRDPESGEVAPWAKKIIDRVREGYIEVSPSHEGVHIILEGTVRGGGMRRRIHPRGKVEMYGRDRFFTVTGRELRQ